MYSKSRYVMNSNYNSTQFNPLLCRFAPITGLYLPAVEMMVSAEYIINAFDKAGIARINSVAFEKNGLYNRVYLGIAYWHDTEAAYNFTARLRNPCVETKFVHDNEYELWWIVHINKYHHKLTTPSKKRTLILFNLNIDRELITNELDEETVTEFSSDVRRLQRQSIVWDEMDLYLCPALLGYPLSFDTEDSYYGFLEEKYAWVDSKLEEMSEIKRLKYELCAM